MTYSIVARDPEDGHMGVATQSQAFSVGSSVSWAAPGHGVIATQSMGEPMYGELGLAGLRAVVLANAGHDDAAMNLARALMVEAPEYAAAARRFGAAGLMDQVLPDRLLPAP